MYGCIQWSSVARDATMQALERAVVTRRGENCWECVVDGAGIGKRNYQVLDKSK